VRGVRGVDAQWVAVKRDWQDAEKRRKQRQDPTSPVTSPGNAPSRFNSMRFRRTSVPELRRSRTGAGRASRTDGAGEKKQGRPSSAQGPRKEEGLLTPKRPATSGGRVSSHGSTTSPKTTLDSPLEHPTTEHNDSVEQIPTPGPAPSPGRVPTPDPKSASAPKFDDPAQGEEEAHYEPEMDDMRCISTEGGITLVRSTNNDSVSSGMREKWAGASLQ
ncbi:unnamed protein product, partial [Rhizoctonia solani]